LNFLAFSYLQWKRKNQL